MSSSYRIELDNWLKTLDVKSDRVLDIGGSQLSLRPRVKSWDVKELLIADLPEPHKDSPRPDIEMDLNLPFEDNVDFRKLYWGKFDLVFCLEVFDYVYDPKQALETIHDLLKDGGTAYVTFPSFYPLHQPIEDDALRYMPGGIAKLAEACGLTIEQMIKRRPETNAIDNAFRIERMRAAKHEDHQFTGFIVEFSK